MTRWQPGQWELCADSLPAGARAAEVKDLKAEEEITVTARYWDYDKKAVVEGEKAPAGIYEFAVAAHNERGYAASETVGYEVLPGPWPAATAAGHVSNCARRATGLELDGYRVDMCFETPDGARRRAWNYGLDSDQSGLLYFFGRDNAEVLVKVLDGCAVNGHRWIFVAPVTTLGFRLAIREPGEYDPDRRQWWFYDSKRRPGREVYEWDTELGFDDKGVWRVLSQAWVGNPQGRTARTVSDTTAFPCTQDEIAAAKAKAAEADGGRAAFLRSRGWTGDGVGSVQRVVSGARTDCEPGAAALTLAGGYRVSLCYETYAGDTGEALDYGLDSSQSGLLYFFERDNAEVLVKVLDGCGVNGHRWVFVAPVTDLAFNLVVESPDGQQRWTHTNRLGQTADAASDVAAFPCSF